jgi:hypothetical protein
MLRRARREEDEPPTRLADLCCAEERELDGEAESLDPMRAAAADARLQSACERLDQRRSNPPRSPL